MKNCKKNLQSPVAPAGGGAEPRVAGCIGVCGPLLGQWELAGWSQALSSTARRKGTWPAGKGGRTGDGGATKFRLSVSIDYACLAPGLEMSMDAREQQQLAP